MFDGPTRAVELQPEPQPRQPAHAGVIDLAVTGLRKDFAGGKEVLKAVSLQILSGQAVALIGPNGAGKSTLLRCCFGLVPIDGGSVQLFGADVTGLSQRKLRALRAGVGFVFQQHNLVPRLSVLSNVLHGSLSRRSGPRRWFQGLAPNIEREKALHYLDLVGMADFAERRADRLSGGQSQRVAIARALMQEPQMVIADEPVASLDPKAAEEIMSLFAGLMEKNKLTFFFSSHHLQHALRYSNRLLGLKSGTLKLDVMTKSVNLANLREIYDSSIGKSWSPASSLQEAQSHLALLLPSGRRVFCLLGSKREFFRGSTLQRNAAYRAHSRGDVSAGSPAIESRRGSDFRDFSNGSRGYRRGHSLELSTRDFGQPHPYSFAFCLFAFARAHLVLQNRAGPGVGASFRGSGGARTVCRDPCDCGRHGWLLRSLLR